MTGKAINVEVQVRALAAGNPVPSGTVLQYARAQALGREIYGEEEIVEHFCRHALTGQARFFGCDQHAVLVWPESALFADLSGNHILRLWRLGPGELLERERQVSVPFDADMMQARGDVFFEASGHPALNDRDLVRVEQAGRSIAQGWRDTSGIAALRVRAFCIRAFSADQAAVALFAVHVVSGTSQRTTSLVHELAIIEDNETFIRDAAGEASERTMAWLPRVD